MEKQKKISDFFGEDDEVTKHHEEAYIGVDMTILDLYRLIEFIDETMLDEESKYWFDEDNKQADSVEVIRYNQKQAIEALRIKLSKQLKEYFLDKEISEEEK